jgi:hypothetical protein
MRKKLTIAIPIGVLAVLVATGFASAGQETCGGRPCAGAIGPAQVAPTPTAVPVLTPVPPFVAPVPLPYPPLQAEPQPNGQPPLLYRPLNSTIGTFLPTPPSPLLSPTPRGGSVTFSLGVELSPFEAPAVLVLAGLPGSSTYSVSPDIITESSLVYVTIYVGEDVIPGVYPLRLWGLSQTGRWGHTIRLPVK